MTKQDYIAELERRIDGIHYSMQQYDDGRIPFFVLRSVIEASKKFLDSNAAKEHKESKSWNDMFLELVQAADWHVASFDEVNGYIIEDGNSRSVTLPPLSIQKANEILAELKTQ